MRKFVASLAFFTLLCLGLSAYTFTVEAWDRDLNVPIETIGPTFTGAKIFINLVEVPGATTPWSFVDAAFIPGSYSVSHVDYYNDQWQPVAVQVNMVYGTYVFRFYGVRRTVPVELSTFTVTMSVQNYVNIMWTTQSETGVSGYYVYRNSAHEFGTAELVSPLIDATNTTQQQSYNFVDNELTESGTYYYWLQSTDYDGSSSFFGPISIIVDLSDTGGGLVPGVISTGFNTIYPNPFNSYTTINYAVGKNSSDVRLNVYNVRGELVRELVSGTLDTNNYAVGWDGKDYTGRNCSTGIYFVVMQSGGESYVRKTTLVK